MNVIGLDIGQIVDLSTSVAQAGASRAVAGSDAIFDFIIFRFHHRHRLAAA